MHQNYCSDAVFFIRQLDCRGCQRVTLLFVNAKRLYINRLLHLITTPNRILHKSLATSEFAYDSSLLELALEFLQRSFNILALFNWYYNHAKTPPFLRVAKVWIIFINGKSSDPFFTNFANQKIKP
jgi:hypothetical protein